MMPHKQTEPERESRGVKGKNLYIYFRAISGEISDKVMFLLLLLLLNQLYNPGCVLACSTIFFQASLPSILVLQFVIFIARRSASTSSFHLVLGLPRDLLSMGFYFIIALTFQSYVSDILNL
jgi:hypothetical protein